LSDKFKGLKKGSWLLGYMLLATTCLSMPTAVSGAPTPAIEYADGQKNAAKDIEANAEATTEAATATLVEIPGTSLSLVPPPGFTLSTHYSGFENLEDFSSIVLTELPPEAYSSISTIFASTPEEITAAFAERGLDLAVESTATVARADTEVSMVTGIQTLGTRKVKKYIALFEEGNTLLLTFNVMAQSPLSEAAVIETIQSAEISPPPSIQETVDALPFTFEAASPFQLIYSLLGSAVVLNLSGEVDPSGTEPLITIASSINPSPIIITDPDDLAAFSERILRETNSDFAEAEIDNGALADFAGGEGYLIEGTVPDSSERVIQYLRVLPDGSYIRLLALGASEDLAELRPAIEAVQGSVLMK